MEIAATALPTVPVRFETSPDAYRHWKLSFDGPIATLAMDVQEDEPLRPGYELKLNSYDLGVDIELADAVQRIRFEHPETRVVVVRSAKPNVFCAGANIYMLGSSTHGWKVNFCKFTNETRCSIEDASRNSGIRFVAALNGTTAGGGYELALACDEIHLIDDGNSAVSLPEVPLLGVLPGTGGLTRLVDKRKVRRDRADVFCTLAEGIKGQRAAQWGLVDAVHPRSKFEEKVAARARELASAAPETDCGAAVRLDPLRVEFFSNGRRYDFVTLEVDTKRRIAAISLRAPESVKFVRSCEFWPLQIFRELDDAILHLRANEMEIGTVVFKSSGPIDTVLAADRILEDERGDRFVREVRLFIARVLRRIDLSSRSFFALVEPGSCFAGSLFEIALASDRIYMKDDPEAGNFLALSAMNGGALPMPHGLSRLQVRFLGVPDDCTRAMGRMGEKLDAGMADGLGLVTFAPDDLDWDDEIRIALEERVALSPDALTGLEANLRFAGAENADSKIYGRLSAWQNWIFIRPNATGERGALTMYGKPERPILDMKRV